MRDPLCLRFKVDRPHWTLADEVDLAYLSINFPQRRLHFGHHGYTMRGQQKHYLYGSTFLANMPGLESDLFALPVVAGTGMLQVVANVYHESMVRTAPGITVPVPVVRSLGQRPVGTPASTIVNPIIGENFSSDDDRWAVLSMPRSPDQGRDAYLDALFVQQIVLDFRFGGSLGLDWQTCVPGVWGLDDKTIIQNQGRDKLPKQQLWDLLNFTVPVDMTFGDAIKKATEALSDVAQKIGAAMYQSTGNQNAGNPETGSAEAGKKDEPVEGEIVDEQTPKE